MPIYEYLCVDCKRNFDVIQKGDKKKARCMLCGKFAERVISKTTFQLKGECWAKDGYSNKGRTNKK